MKIQKDKVTRLRLLLEAIIQSQQLIIKLEVGRQYEKRREYAGSMLETPDDRITENINELVTANDKLMKCYIEAEDIISALIKKEEEARYEQYLKKG